MISHRKYFSIIIMMIVILFMFQFTQVIKETISDYNTNSYAEKEVLSGADRWKPQSEGQSAEQTDHQADSRGFVLLFGKEEYDTTKIVRQWCTYTKRELIQEESVQEYLPEAQNLPEYILIDSAAVDYGRDTDVLVSYAEQGIHLIFLNLPAPSVISANESLKKLLGIQYVQDEQVEVEGIHLFGEFLLGGGYIYRPARKEDEKRQDLDLEMPWYVTLSGTKTYMVGILDELLEDMGDEKNEYFPAVIWRNSYGDTRVFAVNGDYMSDLTGIGILDAMVYETYSYEIHPVINAQNLLLTDYPGFAEENAEVMDQVYSRTPKAVQQDIIWPALLSTVRKSGWKLTCFLAPQYEYLDGNEPAAEDLSFYLLQFKEVDAEAGVSLRHNDSISLSDKAARDGAFYQAAGTAYQYSAAFADTEEVEELKELSEAYLSNLRTIAFLYDKEDPLVSYEDDMLTRQGIVGNARTHTYAEDIQLRGLQTALGYSGILIDIREVMWPDSDKSHWEKLYEEVASNIDTYWKPFAAFEKTTLSESDRRLRLFLNLDYSDRREKDQIFLQVENMGEESWFLLRTHGEAISEITGAEYEEVEEGVYLLHILESQVEIRLEKSRGVLTYTLQDEN